eukprot:259920-Rhodomonas_salina.1
MAVPGSSTKPTTRQRHSLVFSEGKLSAYAHAVRPQYKGSRTRKQAECTTKQYQKAQGYHQSTQGALRNQRQKSTLSGHAHVCYALCRSSTNVGSAATRLRRPKRSGSNR